MKMITMKGVPNHRKQASPLEEARQLLTKAVSLSAWGGGGGTVAFPAGASQAWLGQGTGVDHSGAAPTTAAVWKKQQGVCLEPGQAMDRQDQADSMVWQPRGQPWAWRPVYSLPRSWLGSGTTLFPSPAPGVQSSYPPTCPRAWVWEDDPTQALPQSQAASGRTRSGAFHEKQDAPPVAPQLPRAPPCLSPDMASPLIHLA